MTVNRVSAILSEADRDVVIDAIHIIREKLPFLIKLAPEERKSLPMMGHKSRAFVAKALEVAVQNPDFLPRSVDLAELQQDVELFERLYPLLLTLTELQELVDDTCVAVGNDAYATALMVYAYAKANGKGMGLDGVVDEMGSRFARKSRKGE